MHAVSCSLRTFAVAALVGLPTVAAAQDTHRVGHAGEGLSHNMGLSIGLVGSGITLDLPSGAPDLNGGMGGVAVGYGIRKNITHVARLQFGRLDESSADILQLDGETRYVFNDENVRLRPFVDGGLSYLRIEGKNAGFVKAGLGLNYFLSPRYALEAAVAIGLGKISDVDGTSGMRTARVGFVWHR
ncbi:MAG: outer membrane beta-barrel protein [Gemmatimonadaceae bacterium]|nr:outer membrane beta-barrel protein [Gemmatimonadaceae bacterium]